MRIRQPTTPLCVLGLILFGMSILAGCGADYAHAPDLTPLPISEEISRSAAKKPLPSPEISSITASPDHPGPSATLDPMSTLAQGFDPVPTSNLTGGDLTATPPPASASLASFAVAPTTTMLLPGSRAPDPVAPSFPWLLAFDSDTTGNDEIYLLPAGNSAAVNVTNNAAEDRYPAWSPNGKRIAFQSNRDGNWEVYTLDLETQELTRLTFDQAYDGAPAWSPDGEWIVFESYRDQTACQTTTPTPNPAQCADLEIYRVSARSGALQRLTDSPGGDYQPVWSPDGDWIAFTSWRDGEKEIYVVPANGGPARNVTNHAGDDWFPAWASDGRDLIFLSERDEKIELYRQSVAGGQATRITFNALPEERPSLWPDGSVLFVRYDPGQPFEPHNPHFPGAYHLYRLTTAGGPAHPLVLAFSARHPAAAPLGEAASVSWSGFAQKTSARPSPATSPALLELRRLDDIAAPDPRLVAGVDDMFRKWRTAVYEKSGHDFLGRVSDIFRPAAYFGHPLGYLSWHKAGRAVDLLFDWRDNQGENALFIVREDLAGEVYWRLFLKCAVQDGTMGEPLNQAPWYFWWHTAASGEADIFTSGGRRLPIPPGYFVDVTALAQRYGWSRIASYHLDDFHWHRDSTATEYWHYQRVDDLTWYQAMSQIYGNEKLQELFARPVAAVRGQSEDVMDGKGLPRSEAP